MGSEMERKENSLRALLSARKMGSSETTAPKVSLDIKPHNQPDAVTCTMSLSQGKQGSYGEKRGQVWGSAMG